MHHGESVSWVALGRYVLYVAVRSLGLKYILVQLSYSFPVWIAKVEAMVLSSKWVSEVPYYYCTICFSLQDL